MGNDVPAEFTAEAVAALADDNTLYTGFHRSGEPYRSLIDHNPWLRPPKPDQGLEWGAGWYYDTTVARKHPAWSDVELPSPTKDADRLRHDLREWGFALIEDGVSAEQVDRLRSRIADQAAAERALGIAHLSPAQQHLWALVNKGQVFVDCMTHEPHAVQAGPLIARLIDETVGPGWNHLSFIANISFPGCHPQGLHQDQSLLGPYTHIEPAPVLLNTVYILQDVDDTNGGTLIVPGSHRRYRTDGGTFGQIPPPINLEAPSGTIMLMDGRVLHGGAVNRSSELRYIITNSLVPHWVRQQENFLLTIRPEVLASASPEFLRRAGFQATASSGMVEGYGYFGNGRADDPNGSLIHVRQAIDDGGYQHIGELSMATLDQVDVSRFSAAGIQRHETARNDRYRQRLAAIDSGGASSRTEDHSPAR